MDIGNITVLDLLKIEASKSSAPVNGHPFYQIGKAYLICNVTRYIVGRLVAMTETELVLKEASWVPECGRWHLAIGKGELTNVEPFPSELPVLVNRGAICDASEWRHTLPIGVR